MENRTPHQPADDGINRRGFLKCMAWAGTGLVWTVSGGILGCRQVGPEGKKSGEAKADDATATNDFTFVQLSDSHIGFSRPPNTDVAATLQEAVNRMNALPRRPELLLHTVDPT